MFLSISFYILDVYYKQFVEKIKQIEAEREEHIDEFLALVDLKDIFPTKIPGLPPKQDLDFSIELTPGSVPSLKSPYHMSAP